MEPDRSRATTRQLLRLARAGDREALDALFSRHFPALRRWAHGRLPRWARGVHETVDLVQDVMLHTFQRLDGFQAERQGALQAYLRQAVQNRIRDQLRTFSRRGPHDPLDSGAVDLQPSPFDLAVDSETAGRYRRALQCLKPKDQELIVGSVELGYSYEQLAILAGRPSADSARVAVRRALLRLADEMRHV